MNPGHAYDRRSRLSAAAAFSLAALIGAYGGTLVQSLWSLAGSGSLPGFWEAAYVTLAVVLGIGSAALPLVVLGLAVFGLPFAPFLRRHATRSWVGVFAVLWGAVAGKFAFAAVDHLLTSRGFHPLRLRAPDWGLCYGIPTAVAWWLLERARRRPERDAAASPVRPTSA